LEGSQSFVRISEDFARMLLYFPLIFTKSKLLPPTPVTVFQHILVRDLIENCAMAHAWACRQTRTVARKSSIGGFTFVQGGLNLKNDKNSPDS